MNQDEMLEKLKVIVRPYVRDQDGFSNMTEDSDLLKDLKINSANLVDVVLDIENEFDIMIDNASIEKMLTVRAAMEVIKQKLSEK